MSRRRVAIILAVAVTTVTPPAAADHVGDQAAPPAASSTPLALRPTRPIALAPEPQYGGAAWKAALVLALLGGAAICLRRRTAPASVGAPALAVVRRTSLGLRSELIVVNVEGQRLLIGVTPQSIQSLAILDGDSPEDRVHRPGGREESTLGERFAAMLETATRGVSPTAATVRAERPRRSGVTDRPSVHQDDIAEQARGLSALRRPG